MGTRRNFSAEFKAKMRYCQMLWMARERIPAISGCLFHFTVDEWHPLDDLGDELVAGESAPVFLRIRRPETGGVDRGPHPYGTVLWLRHPALGPRICSAEHIRVYVPGSIMCPWR